MRLEILSLFLAVSASREYTSSSFSTRKICIVIRLLRFEQPCACRDNWTFSHLASTIRSSSASACKCRSPTTPTQTTIAIRRPNAKISFAGRLEFLVILKKGPDSVHRVGSTTHHESEREVRGVFLLSGSSLLKSCKSSGRNSVWLVRGRRGRLPLWSLYRRVGILPTSFCQYILRDTQEDWFLDPKSHRAYELYARRLDLFCSVSVITLLNRISGSLEAVHGLLQGPLQYTLGVVAIGENVVAR